MSFIPLASKQLGPPSAAHDHEPFEYRRQRAGKLKSRLGCLTCKARRVKCDERKPICARCEKTQMVCNGYIQPELRSKIEPTGSPLHPLLPRASTVTKPSQRLLSQLPRSFNGLPTVCGKNGSYFDIFRHHVAPDLSRYYYADLWSSVISEGLQDGFHRLSIIASWSHRNITNHHHRASILHHLRAISSFRSSIQNRDSHFRPRKVFIMTLLLVEYEILQGNLSAADSLLSYGLGMFRYSTTLFQDNAMTIAEIIDVEHILPCVAVMGMFTHQLNSSWTHILQLRAEPEFKIPEFGIDDIPKVYSWWGRFYTHAVTCLCQISYGRKLSIFEAVARRGSFLSCLSRWKSTLNAYLDSCETSTTERRALRLIFIHWQVLWVSVNCCLDPTGVAFDAFTDEFSDMLWRSVKFIKDDISTDTPLLMTFGEGIFMPLLCVVACCRDHDLRMTAAAVAYGLPWQEGTWDTRVVLLGQLGSVIMEEKGRDESGFIPPTSRWYWRGGDIHPKSRRMTSRYLQHVPGDHEKTVTKSLSIDLDRWPDICSAVGCVKDHAAIINSLA
ncbi:hypothetical protein M431DRAFT_127197 [Trichoderma harzianum CBS 226.95]|uniref:Zn(2)-C6 fungal-type domain-containing protein n=1 Tax=Trichoderma harzianum CBS 226.95 TaxID=983964 RepID=A0A2T3ZW57_TRIHA|nr:hypothetical protein M431DRAFT_127197 [Trichoderma harzianum CBS 226.95]PTB49018.1 hypothetical protein M431DRAFT_127197 [Trichoderma harzianum CBS 226.95]